MVVVVVVDSFSLSLRTDSIMRLRGGKDSLGFLFLYELMTNKAMLKILPNDDPYNWGCVLLRMMPPMVSRIMCRIMPYHAVSCPISDNIECPSTFDHFSLSFPPLLHFSTSPLHTHRLSLHCSRIGRTNGARTKEPAQKWPTPATAVVGGELGTCCCPFFVGTWSERDSERQCTMLITFPCSISLPLSPPPTSPACPTTQCW